MFPQPSSLASFEMAHQDDGQQRRKYPLNASGFSRVDVLSGRGGLANTHEGNRVFRRLVDLNKKCYHGLKTKRDKNILVESIVLAIQRQGGRFLKQNTKTGFWDEEIPFKQALLKTGQALREQVKKARQTLAPKINVVPAPAKQQQQQQQQKPQAHQCEAQDEDDDTSLFTRGTVSSSQSSSSSSSSHRPPVPTIKSMDFCHVEACSDDDDDEQEDDFLAAALAPPMLRMWSSALHPATSRIANDLDNRLDDVPPPPVYSFDEVLLRQESLGVSGSFLPMPEMSFGTSVMCTALDLIDG